MTENLIISMPLVTMPDEVKSYVDSDFLKKLRARNSQAIAEVIEANNSYLLKAAIGYRFTRLEAEEVVSNTWAAFFESIHRFEGRSKIRTFLYGILFNKVREYRRELSKARLDVSMDDVIHENFDDIGNFKKNPIDPEKFLAAAQNMESIKECLESLEDPYKTAFFLKEVEGEDTEEICKVLDINANNLNVILFRARNKLRVCIEGKARQEALRRGEKL